MIQTLGLVLIVISLYVILCKRGTPFVLIGLLSLLSAATFFLNLRVNGLLPDGVLAALETSPTQRSLELGRLTITIALLFILLTSIVLRSQPAIPYRTAEAPKPSKRSTHFYFNVTAALIYIFITLRFFIYFLSVDFDVLWHNSTYLLLASALSLEQVNALSLTSISLQSEFGLLAFIVLGISVLRNAKIIFILFLPVAALHLTLELCAASRYSVAYLMTLVGFVFFNQQRSTLLLITLVALTISTYSYVLFARMHGNFGISMLFFDAGYLNFYSFARVLQNVFQPFEIFCLIFETSAAYPTSYAIMSFSPLISGLDGFANLRGMHEARHHIYVPFGSFTEAVNFGGVYIFLYLSFLYMSLLRLVKLERVAPTHIAIPLMLVFNLFVLLAFSYPVRNVFRIFLAIWILTEILIYANRARVRTY